MALLISKRNIFKNLVNSLPILVLQTAPSFLITDKKEFEKEKIRLIDYLNKTQGFGEHYFDGKESHSFGKLTKKEWNNMFYKHLDHHLNQFGV
ncbi:hypothetical protein [Pedobacter aquatilis]|uniref:hypothetical protein n=1 Tax=Pedobacter aquatilis TaxID=351343 RepID=UPI00292FFB4D|nr:hypothetical protein [Pedobacter aquatilis]